MNRERLSEAIVDFANAIEAACMHTPLNWFPHAELVQMEAPNNEQQNIYC